MRLSIGWNIADEKAACPSKIRILYRPPDDAEIHRQQRAATNTSCPIPPSSIGKILRARKPSATSRTPGTILNGSDAREFRRRVLRTIVNNEPRPQMDWSFEKDGSIPRQDHHEAHAGSDVAGDNPKARDFRLDTIGKAYTSTVLDDKGGGVYIAKIDKPDPGWTAFFIEVTFPTKTSSIKLNNRRKNHSGYSLVRPTASEALTQHVESKYNGRAVTIEKLRPACHRSPGEATSPRSYTNSPA